jgi:hypothetical protein
VPHPGRIRPPGVADGTLRGNEAKPEGFGPNAIKEQVLDSSKLNAAKIGKVPGAALADGLTRHGVISSAGAPVRGRGVTSAAKTGDGQRHRPDLGDFGGEQCERRACDHPQQRGRRQRGPLVPSDRLLLRTGRGGAALTAAPAGQAQSLSQNPIVVLRTPDHGALRRTRAQSMPEASASIAGGAGRRETVA